MATAAKPRRTKPRANRLRSVAKALERVRKGPLGDYQQSAAATYYANSMAVKHRPKVAAAFQLGLAIEGTFWMAQRRKFEYSELSSFSAPRTLAALNAQARALGAKPVSVAGLDTDEVDPLNREMQLLVRELDHNLAERL